MRFSPIVSSTMVPLGGPTAVMEKEHGVVWRGTTAAEAQRPKVRRERERSIVEVKLIKCSELELLKERLLLKELDCKKE